MTRFFALIVACLGLGCAASEAGQIVIEFEERDYVTVSGPCDDVAAFVIRYQDALWPDWRMDKKYADLVNAAVRGAKKSGKAMLWAGSDKAKAAITTASVALPIPGIDE